MEDDEDVVVQPKPELTAREIAAEIVALQAPVQRQQMQAPQVFDSIAESIQKLKNEGYPDEFIRGSALATQAVRIEYDQKLNNLKQELLGAQQVGTAQNTALKVIADALRPHAKAEAIVKKADVAIRAEIEQKFWADPVNRAKWDRGIVDTDAIEKITESVVEDFLHAAGRTTGNTKSSVAPIKTSGNNAMTTQKKVESTDDLDDNQAEFYESFKTALNTYGSHGIKGEGRPKTPAEIEAYALKRASTVIQPILKKAIR